MENLTKSLKEAIESRNWYGALFIALALPDICGKIDDPNAGSGARYATWFSNYVQPKYTVRRIRHPDYSRITDPVEKADIFQKLISASPKTEETKEKEELIEQAWQSKDGEAYIAYSKEFHEIQQRNNPFSYDYVFLSGNDCYALRCAYLHEGTDDITDQRAQDAIERFHFRTPKYLPDGTQGGKVHINMSKESILQLQIDIFCTDILDGVNEWVSAILTDDPRHQKLASRLRIYAGDKKEGPPIF